MPAKRGVQPIRILDVGGGDGEFLYSVVRKARRAWVGGEATILDRQRTLSTDTEKKFQALGWTLKFLQIDVLTWLSLERWDLIICNLFLHHFQDAELRQVLASMLLRSDCLVACEPRRSARALRAAQLLWGIGCNHVTRHDAVLSVRAGFHGRELTELSHAPGFTFREESAGLFSHLFVARRIGL